MFWERIKNIIKQKMLDFPSAEARADSDHKRTYRRESKEEDFYQTSNLSQEAKYYKLLEMEPSNNLDDIKSQYRKLIRKYHPDRHHSVEDKREAAETLSIALNEAMEYFEKKYE